MTTTLRPSPFERLFRTVAFALIALGLVVVSQRDAAAATPGKIKFKDGSGATAFSIKPKDDGAKLVDGAEKELARYNVSGEKTKIKDPDDKVLGYVVGAGARFKVTAPDQNKILFKLIRQDDGDWKLEDGADGLIYRIKKRDYGFEIEDGKDTSLAKAKKKGDKSSLRDSADKTLFSTNDPIRPEALACLAFDRITDLRLRMALAVCLNSAEPSR